MEKIAADEETNAPRATMQRLVVMAFPVTVAIWLATYFLLPPLQGMADPITRLQFAVNCTCLAALLCLLPGIQAVAHERLNSTAINPLAGAESSKMRINLRYLQNTLEQFVLFVPGLLALSFYAADGYMMRAVVATTLVWIISRGAFWIGYHRAPEYRAIGLPGASQSLLVLLFVGARFGYDLGGVAGASAPLALFIATEIYLVRTSRVSG